MALKISYIESSIILSILLEDDHYPRAASAWNESEEKITSILTPIEVFTVLRRALSAKKGEANLRSREKRANELMKEISILILDQEIRDLIEVKREFSECRSLDAIHVASGYYVHRLENGIDIDFYSFDNRVNQVAKKVGLKPKFLK